MAVQAVIVTRPRVCLLTRIWPKLEDCAHREQLIKATVAATKVNTKNTTGEYVAE